MTSSFCIYKLVNFLGSTLVNPLEDEPIRKPFNGDNRPDVENTKTDFLYPNERKTTSERPQTLPAWNFNNNGSKTRKPVKKVPFRGKVRDEEEEKEEEIQFNGKFTINVAESEGNARLGLKLKL